MNRKLWLPVNRNKNLITLIPAIFLLLALRDGWSYDFFNLLRVIVFGASIYLSWLAYINKKQFWSWALGFVAFIFNPVFPLHFGRNLWVKIDIAVAVFLIISIFIFKVEEQK